MSRMKKRLDLRRGVIVAGVLTAGIVSVAPAQDDEPGGHGGGRPATSVRAVRVDLEEIQERRRVTGELRAVRRSRVATREPGLVSELPVEEGTRVKAGAVLAVLDSRRLAIELLQLEAQVKVASATVAATEAQLALEESDLDALRSLSAAKATNPKELADAASQVRVASARLEGARREVEVTRALADLLGVRLEDTTIRAPIDGVVVSTSTERGEWVAEGDPIVEIVSSGQYDAWLDVPQRYAPRVIGRREPVQVMIDATEQRIEPRIPVIVPQVDPTARTFGVYVRIDDTETVLAPGMSVTGWIPTGERGSYLTVPRDALLRNQAGFFVYVGRGGPGGPQMATPVQVKIAFETETRVAVRPGALRVGDVVVVEGNERLFPMMPIAPRLEKEPETPDVAGGIDEARPRDAAARKGGA